jgi:hypothetical protein
MLVLDPVPNYLELSLVVKPEGLSSGMLPGLGEVLLDFQKAAISYRSPTGDLATIALAAHTQASLLEALLGVIDTRIQLPRCNEYSSRTDALLGGLEARGHPFTPTRDDLAAREILRVDPGLAGDYGAALYRIFTATARFRAHLNGPMTPLVVWPEHFDLSFLWFATDGAHERFPHMNFGFAPFSDDIPRPYLYAYAYPMPPDFEHLPLPPGALWHTDGWQGLVFPYDQLVAASDPEMAVEEVFTAVYHLLSPTLGVGGSAADRSPVPTGATSPVTERR